MMTQSDPKDGFRLQVTRLHSVISIWSKFRWLATLITALFIVVGFGLAAQSFSMANDLAEMTHETNSTPFCLFFFAIGVLSGLMLGFSIVIFCLWASGLLTIAEKLSNEFLRQDTERL